MKKSESQNTADKNIAESVQKGKKQYQAPEILSVERLEAAAVTCDPPEGGFGKSNVGGLGSPCSTLGS